MKTIEFTEYIFKDTINSVLIENALSNVYEIYDRYPHSINKSNVNGWQRHGLHETQLFDSLIQNIFQSFDKTMNYVHDKYSKKVDEEQGWDISLVNLFANINKKGSYHRMHDHYGCDYSGVVYLKTPKNSGDIFLQSPFRSPWMTKFSVSTNQAYYKQITPYPGLLLIFPSYILHHVDPNQTDEDRVSMSFNITM